MTACALPRFMFTWVPSGNVRLTPESMSQDSDRGAGLSVAIGRNRLPESSDKGGIGSPMPSCRQSRRRFLASFTDSPLFSIHRFILPCLTLHLFRKEVRVAVGLWDSSFKNAFHTLSYRFAAVILVILYSRGKGKELKDAEQGCIADTLTIEAGFITRPRAGVYQISHLVSQTDIAKSIYQKSFLANNPTLSEDYHFFNHFYFEFVG